MTTQFRIHQDAFKENFPYEKIGNTLIYGVAGSGKSTVFERIVDRLVRNPNNRVIRYSRNATRLNNSSEIEIEKFADDVLYKAAGASNERSVDMARYMNEKMVHQGNTVYAAIDSFENIQNVTAIAALREILNEKLQTKVHVITTTLSHPFTEEDVLTPGFKPSLVNPSSNGILHRAWSRFDQIVTCLPGNQTIITAKCVGE